jgi:hypothetical protein
MVYNQPASLCDTTYHSCNCVVLLPVVGRFAFLRKVHEYLGVLLLSLPSCSAADTGGGDPTPTSNDALLVLDIPPLVEVWASEHYSFWLFFLLHFGLANMFFVIGG